MFDDKNKIDLHGIKHENVSSLLDDFMWKHISKKSNSITIITGKSDVMKKIVSKIVIEYGFSINEGMSNTGVLYVNLS